ncbi:MAG: hypothetical protein ACFFC5_06840 [Promethearchaeota archaeon]
MPIVFTSPWLLFIYIYRNRLANTFEIWREKTTIVPLRWIIFYGINTSFVALFFLLPFASPPLGVFMSAVAAWRVVLASDFAWNRSRKSLVGYTIFVLAIVSAVPILLLILFYPAYLPIWNWITIAWSDSINLLYAFSIWIVNSITIGSFVWFLGNLLRRQPISEALEVTGWKVRVFDSFLFCTFAFLWLPQLGNMQFLFDYINPASLGIMGIVILLRLKWGEVGRGATALGILVGATFLFIEIFYRFNLMAMTVSIVVAALMFFLTFVYCFAQASEEEF